MKKTDIAESNLDCVSSPFNVDQSPSEKEIDSDDSNIKKVCRFLYIYYCHENKDIYP